MLPIAFDLDGTLSDPASGITTSINYALEQVGEPPRDPATLLQYIGPPLTKIFADLLLTRDRLAINEAIEHYRTRYRTVGYKENLLYDGIPDLLADLQVAGYRLYVATSKRSDIAALVIEHFNLTTYFEQVFGCGPNQQKRNLLTEILEIESANTLLMIGDRSYDMSAAKQISAQSVGVLWGYGSRLELEENGADTVVENTTELKKYF